MTFVADSSFLLRLYLRDAHTSAIEHFLTEDTKVVSLSELARIEVLNTLLRYEGRSEQFIADLKERGRLQLEWLDWPRAFHKAESLARRFSRALRPADQDLVVVGAALTMGATWFLSFDKNSRQRPLAAAAGLRVWPVLDKEEKSLTKRGRRRS